MLFKLLPYFTLWLGLILVGCTNNNTQQQNPFDLECRIVELKDSIIKTENEIIVYKSTKASKLKIDSLQNQISRLNTNLDSLLLQTIENNFDSIEDNLVELFNLKTPNHKQEQFLLFFLAYKVEGPNFNYCGFDILPNDPLERTEWYKKHNQAQENYKNYIDSIVTPYTKMAYPKLDNKYYHSLEIIAENYIYQSKNNQLIDSASAISHSDSNLLQLYKKKSSSFYRK